MNGQLLTSATPRGDSSTNSSPVVGYGRTDNCGWQRGLSPSPPSCGFSAAVLNVAEEQELATALVVVGCLFAALATGGIGARVGLKKTILGNNVLYIIGSTVCALAISKRVLYAGRLLLGIASGVVTNTVPILLTEISSAASRGEITALHQLSLTIGWRYVNGFMVLLPLVQCLSMSFMPESLWWLMMNRGRAECRATLVFLRPSASKGAIETELQKIAHVMEHQQHELRVNWSSLLVHMVTGTILVFFQAMTGVTNPFFATAVVDVMNVGITVISLQGMVAVSSVLMFFGGFAVGLGAVVSVMVGDITPVHICTQAFAFYMVVSYICNIVIAVGTLSAIDFLGRSFNPEKNGIAKLYLILRQWHCNSVPCLHLLLVEETSHSKTAPITDDLEPLFADEEQGAVEEEIRDTTDL
ncbi:unnamed protein product [Peronospora destructor]|uniref:Major facilitator superfamily (MFS) profile domain-containing protein n=1 Tax=Peronospora destructor TaxID=86335 RepID=A0AAV0VFK1_9STRA|nr:unnamed protein product [Peronospora destructor]